MATLSNREDACRMNGSIAGLGIVVLIVGVFLSLYSETYTQSVYGVTLITRIEYPYRTYGFILLLVGILSLVLGLAMPKKSDQI